MKLNEVNIKKICNYLAMHIHVYLCYYDNYKLDSPLMMLRDNQVR